MKAWAERKPAEVDHAQEYWLAAMARRAVLEGLRGPQVHGPLASLAEGFTVLAEEVDEVWEHVRGTATGKVSDELIQVAAVALRMAVMARRKGQ